MTRRGRLGFVALTSLTRAAITGAMKDDERILIAGGGPIGIVTGLALARAGIPVTIFDSLAEIPTDHRAATLHPSTLALIEPLGMTKRLIPQGIISARFQYRDRETDEIVAEFDYKLLEGEAAYPFALQVEQHKTIAVARDLGLAEPLFDLRRRHTVTAVRQANDFVEIEVENPAGEIERHRGRYLVGADGGRSVARKSQNIDFPGFTWEERFIIVATTFDFGAAARYRYRNYVAHPARWCALMKVPGEDNRGLYRCLFPAMTGESDEQVRSDEWIQARFKECLPYGAPYPIVHRNLYNIHQRVAARFRVGRVALAGDSAHVNNPIGGMGMNSGIHDGLNLAAKLAAIWRGEASEDVLDRYDRQRRPMAQKYVQAQSIQNKQILEERDPAVRKTRLDELRRQAADEGQARAFLRRASLIAMWQESESIE